MENAVLRPQAEQRYQEELEALRLWDQENRKPQNWLLSPKAVRLFILGSRTPVRCGGQTVTIRKKYLGNDALVERCIITLAGNRGLMLVGEPGTAKTMLSELLSAAISGCSTNTVQGTAGTTEDMIKYSWNYALLLANGPSRQALVPSPLYVGMEKGILTRFEELTRTPAEVQDSLISVLSDKVLNIPELGDEGLLFARPGFNVIGTANTRDKGVNEMSSALKRRFNFETVQPVRDVALEKQIIAEAISVYYQTMMTAWYYGDGRMDEGCLVENLVGAVAKESQEDMDKLASYFSTVVREKARREGGAWTRYYQARGQLK